MIGRDSVRPDAHLRRSRHRRRRHRLLGERNILEIVEYYMSFFVHESCGYCTPCRVGNVFLQKAIAKFRKGKANPSDIDTCATCRTIIETSRCGLGMTSPNPILSTLENFPLVYSAVVKPSRTECAPPSISSRRSTARASLAKRRSYIFDKDFSASEPDQAQSTGSRSRQGRPDDHGGRRRRGHLHPAALRPRGAAPSGRLPGLHGQGATGAAWRPARSPQARG
jgi:hypothetical protein